MKISAVNENTFLLSVADQAGPQTIADIAHRVEQIKTTFGSLIVDMVPSYTSILVEFDLAQTSAKTFQQALIALCAEPCDKVSLREQAPIIELPVYYGKEVALDQAEVCSYTGLSPQAFIELHSTPLYHVYAIGFTPGFAYLGNTDQRLAMPRKSTPRAQIPAGSLAIADRQTAIYPQQSPGGWQVIGRAPCSMIDFNRENFTVFKVGAQVKFKPLTKEAYLNLGGSFDPLAHAMGKL